MNATIYPANTKPKASVKRKGLASKNKNQINLMWLFSKQCEKHYCFTLDTLVCLGTCRHS